MLSGHDPLKGRLEGARPVQYRTGIPKNASLFVPGIGNTRRASGFEIASRVSLSELKPYDLPPSALGGDLPRKESLEGLGSVTIASNEAATPTAHDGKPIL